MQMDKKGITATVVFHAILLLLFLLFGFSTPLPLPGERGILINFGTSSQGFGSVEPAMSEPAKQEEIAEPVPPSETQKTSSDKNIMTQDYEEAPSLPVKKETTKKKTEPVKTNTKPVQKPKVEEKPAEPVKTVDPRTLYTGKNTSTQTSGSEGDTKPGGNQGSPEGDVNSQSRIGGPTGGGVGYSLEGRGKVYLPEPSLNYKQQGIVVVEILVDQDGNVVSAREGVKGTTTADVTLLRLAREAALKSKFSAKEDAPMHQKGTITYHFNLR